MSAFLSTRGRVECPEGTPLQLAQRVLRQPGHDPDHRRHLEVGEVLSTERPKAVGVDDGDLGTDAGTDRAWPARPGRKRIRGYLMARLGNAIRSNDRRAEAALQRAQDGGSERRRAGADKAWAVVWSAVRIGSLEE